jgi:hypothetical protein
VRGAGGVDEQERIRPARGFAGRSVWPSRVADARPDDAFAGSDAGRARARGQKVEVVNYPDGGGVGSAIEGARHAMLPRLKGLIQGSPALLADCARLTVSVTIAPGDKLIGMTAARCR